MAKPTAVWLYAVARDPLKGSRTLPTGVGGEAIRTVEEAGLVAVVGTVDLRAFGQEALTRNLENLEWLAATARAHNIVVGVVEKDSPTVPVRLATMFADDEAVRLMLRERKRDFDAVLRRLVGHKEWGVKGYADPEVLAAASEPEAEATAGGGGTAYLLRRRAQLSARESAARTSAAYAEDVHARLSRLADDSRRHEPQDPALSGHRGWMVLNGAYLVDDQRIDAFVDAVSALETWRPGLRVELTGPWPAYSFIGVDGENDG
jgi:hypothetical protein